MALLTVVVYKGNEMIKTKQVISVAILILIPVIYGLFFWDKLPDDIATHITNSGKEDWFLHKSMLILAYPLFLCLIYMLVYRFFYNIIMTTASDIIFNNFIKIFKIISIFLICVSHLGMLSMLFSELHSSYVLNTTQSFSLVYGAILLIAAFNAHTIFSLNFLFNEEYEESPLDIKKKIDNESSKYLIDMRIMLYVIGATFITNCYFQLMFLNITLGVIVILGVLIYPLRAIVKATEDEYS